MPLLPVQIIGSTYESRDTAISNQVTRNLYPEINPNTRSETALQSFPAPKLITQGQRGDACRGLYNWNGVLYKVSGSTLCRVGQFGELTSIGTVSGNSRCVFAANQSSLVIASGGRSYVYNGSTLTESTDAGLGSPDTVAQLQNVFIYDNGGSDDNWSVSVAGTPEEAFADASAESRADNLLRPYAFRNQLYNIGSQSIEPWFFTGNGTLGFELAAQGMNQIGCAAKYSVANTDKFVYFVGTDHSVYRMVQYQVENVTSVGIAHFLENNEVSDAIGYTMVIERQHIYLLILPTANKTLCYSEENNTWFELSSGLNGDRSRINSYAYCYGKHWIGDKDTGSIYQLDLNTFTDNGQPYRRERITAPINAGSAGVEGRSLLCKSLHVTMKSGVGNASTEKTPKIMFQYSIDDGNSWSSEHWVDLGRLNEIQKVRFDHMITSREIRYKMAVTDDCNVVFHSAALDVEFVEW